MCRGVFSRAHRPYYRGYSGYAITPCHAPIIIGAGGGGIFCANMGPIGGPAIPPMPTPPIPGPPPAATAMAAGGASPKACPIGAIGAWGPVPAATEGAGAAAAAAAAWRWKSWPAALPCLAWELRRMVCAYDLISLWGWWRLGADDGVSGRAWS